MAAAILIAASSNNLLKTGYAVSFAGGRATAGSAAALIVLAIVRCRSGDRNGRPCAAAVLELTDLAILKGAWFMHRSTRH